MIYEYCRYDARKSRESVNIKIHLSLDEFFLLSYTCESATYKYHMINTGTSCYNFSSRIKKKRSVHVSTAMYRFLFLKIFWISGSHPRAEKKTAETDYFLHQCFYSTCMIYKTLHLVSEDLFLSETIYLVFAPVNQIYLFKFDRQVARYG